MREAASFIAGQRSTPTGALQTLLAAFARMVRSLAHRRNVIRLIDMDDHLLADIGIAREDVRQALDLPFQSDPSVELQRIALRKHRGWRA